MHHASRVLPLLGLALLAGCASSSGSKPDAAQRRVDDIDARVKRLDRILDNQSLVQLAQRVDSLQAEVRAQNGRIEELQNANEGLRKQQRDLYQDLDQRLKNGGARGTVSLPPQPAPSAAVPVVPTPSVAVPAQPAVVATPAQTTVPAAAAASTAPVSDEQAQYNKAFDTLKGGDYAEAVNAFRQLAGAYPKGQLADNTQYWLGEAYYVMRDYDHAAACFEGVLQGWPNSRKAPDALLKLAYTQFEQKKAGAGRANLQLVITKFPGTDAARLAAERLQKLPADAR